MGLWLLLLLLLHLHLVVSVFLPAPSNVTIYSFNMEHTLSFTPGPETPSRTHFTVEILRHWRSYWRPVAGCLELTAGQTCNLTRAFKDPFDHYHARVQAFTPNQTSNWTVSRLFQPLTDTVLGPPDVSVSGCGNCLLLQLRSWGLEQLKDHHGEVLVHVQRTRDGAQFRLSLHYKEEMEIRYLQPGVEYCVTVSVEILFNSNSVPSRPYCAFTSPPPTGSLYVVYILLSTVCLFGFLLVGFVVYSSRLRRRLSTALSYVLLRGQNHGGAPAEHSGQISAIQIHKDGSADCLLSDHRPVQPMRSSSEGGKEESLL